MIQSDPNSRLYELTRRISLRSYDRIAAGILSILLVIVLGACRDSGSSQTGNTDPNTTTDSSGDFSITLHVDGPRQVTITWDNPPEYYLFYKLLDYYSVVYQSGAVAVPSTSGFSYTFNYLSPQSTYCYRAEVMALYQVLWTYQWIGWSSAEVCATTPPDTTAPPPGTTALAVSSTQPAYGETSVMVNTAITVTFSENIDPRTVDSSTFFVTGPSGTVSGSISIAAWAATFRPDINLAYLTDYQVTVTTGVKDLWGHALPSPYIWTFTTGVTPDNNPPTAPEGLAAVDDTSGQILLSWDPASDNAQVAGYKIYRDGSFVRSVVSTTAFDAGLYISSQVCYAVSAFDGAGNESPQSSPVCVVVGGLQPGAVGAWGFNDRGQLGDGTTTSRYEPVQVLNLRNITAIAAGGGHSLALRSDGSVWTWGGYYQFSMPVQVLNLGTVTAIAAGAEHSLALRSDGTVWAWGSNAAGQLGNYTTSDRSDVPVQVLNISNVTAIAAGGHGSLALRADGTVWAWGRSAGFWCVDPIPVSSLSNITAVATSGYHSLALRSDGSAWAWGENAIGQLGDGTTSARSTPVPVLNMTDAIAIAAGWNHSLALRSDRTVWAWGLNNFGQLGNGTTTSTNEPVQVLNLNTVSAIAAGGDHSLALNADGTVWAWGINGWGQLGDGTRLSRNTPVQTLHISNITAFGTGAGYSLVLR